jgi:hypothetical protein
LNLGRATWRYAYGVAEDPARRGSSCGLCLKRLVQLTASRCKLVSISLHHLLQL